MTALLAAPAMVGVGSGHAPGRFTLCQVKPDRDTDHIHRDERPGRGALLGNWTARFEADRRHLADAARPAAHRTVTSRAWPAGRSATGELYRAAETGSPPTTRPGPTTWASTC